MNLGKPVLDAGARCERTRCSKFGAFSNRAHIGGCCVCSQECRCFANDAASLPPAKSLSTQDLAKRFHAPAAASLGSSGDYHGHHRLGPRRMRTQARGPSRQYAWARVLRADDGRLGGGRQKAGASPCGPGPKTVTGCAPLPSPRFSLPPFAEERAGYRIRFAQITPCFTVHYG